MARGDIFTAPIEKGPTRNLTRSSGAHDKWARWSPDGTEASPTSPMPGRRGGDLPGGSGRIGRLAGADSPDGGQAMRYAPEWSPDGEPPGFRRQGAAASMFWTWKSRTTVQLIADEERGQLRDYVWSPHGGYLAFSMSDPSGFQSDLHLERRRGASLHAGDRSRFVQRVRPGLGPRGRITSTT